MKNQITFAIVTVAIAAVLAGLSTIVLGDGIQTAYAQGPPSPFPGQGQVNHKYHHLLFQDKVMDKSGFPEQGQGQRTTMVEVRLTTRFRSTTTLITTISKK